MFLKIDLEYLGRDPVFLAKFYHTRTDMLKGAKPYDVYEIESLVLDDDVKKFLGVE